MRDVQAWSALDVLVPLVFVGVLYALCDLVLPEGPIEGQTLDLCEYHVQEGWRYEAINLLLAVVAFLLVARSSASFGQWLGASRFALIAGACSAIALSTRRVWLDTLAAVVLLAMGIIFLTTHLAALA